MAELSLDILTVAFSDEVKAKRVAEVVEKIAELETRQKAVADAQARADATLEEARQLHRDAAALRAEADQIKAEFAEKNKGLEDAISNHSAQATEFLNSRAEIEQGHRDRGAVLDAREAALKNQAEALAEHEAAVKAREDKVDAKETELAGRETKLSAIVAQLSGSEKAA